ncbi:MAG TPA: S41 family peptidase [Allosphingosinicella sp.]
MKAFLFAVAAAVAPSASTAQQVPQPAPQQEVDWRSVARSDVLAAYEIYVANHPGMYDPRNPGFRAQLARARDRGLAFADRARDREGYTEALGAFSSVLSDGHAQAYAIPAPSGTAETREWPGFVAAWRADKLLVHYAASGFPASEGSRIVSCDNRKARDFVIHRLQNRRLRPEEAGGWWFWAPRAFYSSSSFQATRPVSCRFRIGKSEREVPLQWSPAPTDFDDRLAAATDGERTPIGLTEPRPGLFLIGMPSFNPDAAGVEAYRALYDTLRAKRADLARARAVVIDLRHNNGGSSYWSADAGKILWGETAVNRRIGDYFRNVSIWWRTSEGNVAYMAEMEAQMRGNGQIEGAESTRRTAEAMRAALGRGEAFFVKPDEEAEAARASQGSATSDFGTPVYVITAGRCASACLDALDLFTRFPNVRLIGAPTSGDTTYMEVRAMNLPSGRGKISIPNKIWVGRPRASGQVYTPAIPVNDLDWSTNTFLDRIEKDLAARR